MGFTLIEVMIAMLILAVGLLSLTGLGVRGVRSLGEAGRNTHAAVTATEMIEGARSELRRNQLPEQQCDTLPNGGVVSRAVAVQNNRRLVRVSVTVTPDSRGRAPRPFAVQDYSLLPQPVPGSEAPSGSAC
jgi:type IV pilus modification protein PilV